MRVIALASLTVSTLGCALFNPYLVPDEPTPGVVRSRDGTPIRDSSHYLQARSVSVDDASLYGRSICATYTDRLNELSATRVSANMGMIGTALAALGVAATGGASQAATILGLTGVGLGAFGSQVIVSTYRTIYTQGSIAIECSIGVAQANRGAHLPLIATRIARSSLSQAISDLDSRIAATTQVVSTFTAPADTALLGESVEMATRTSSEARAVMNATEGVEDDLDPLGQLLLSQIEGIRMRVNAEVAKAEPDLLTFNQALRDQLLSGAASYDTKGLGALAKPTADHKKVDKSKASAEAVKAADALEAARLRVGYELEKYVNSINANIAHPITYKEDLFKSCALALTPGGGGQKQENKETADDEKKSSKQAAVSAEDDKDPRVEKIQTYLAGEAKNDQHPNPAYDPGTVDGKMGKQTRLAAQAYLRANFDQIDASARPSSAAAIDSLSDAELVRLVSLFLGG